MSKESPFKELESDIVEETGVKCCICLEGYKNQPQKVCTHCTLTVYSHNNVTSHFHCVLPNDFT